MSSSQRISPLVVFGLALLVVSAAGAAQIQEQPKEAPSEPVFIVPHHDPAETQMYRVDWNIPRVRGGEIWKDSTTFERGARFLSRVDAPGMPGLSDETTIDMKLERHDESSATLRVSIEESIAKSANERSRSKTFVVERIVYGRPIEIPIPREGAAPQVAAFVVRPLARKLILAHDITLEEVLAALPEADGFRRERIRCVLEPLESRIDDAKFFPMIGPARLVHRHYRCTVHYQKVLEPAADGSAPQPEADDETVEIVFIDHDTLIRAAGNEVEAK